MYSRVITPNGIGDYHFFVNREAVKIESRGNGGPSLKDTWAKSLTGSDLRTTLDLFCAEISVEHPFTERGFEID